jgi:hypothetical protein
MTATDDPTTFSSVAVGPAPTRNAAGRNDGLVRGGRIWDKRTIPHGHAR